MIEELPSTIFQGTDYKQEKIFVVRRKLSLIETLQKTAIGGEDIDARISAVVKLANIGKIASQRIFEDIAQNDQNESLRNLATTKIIDENVLMNIVLDDQCENVREKAWERITDKIVLINIAKSCKDENLRIRTIGKIIRHEILGDNAENLLSEDDIQNIAKRILYSDILVAQTTNKEVLANFSRTIVEFTTSEEVLADIAKSARSSDLSKTAIIKISDNNILQDINKNAPQAEIRKLARLQISGMDIKPKQTKAKSTPPAAIKKRVVPEHQNQNSRSGIQKDVDNEK